MKKSGSSSTSKQIKIATLATVGACTLAQAPVQSATFTDDLNFLRQNTDVVVLSDKSGNAAVALVPAMQGRVMTSTAQGPGGFSFGWINRELVASKKFQQHINVFGGEDRFWMGPEGGQYSIFFAKGVPFDLEHWFTPAPIDTEPFTLASKKNDRAEFTKEFTLTNYSGTTFSVKVNREIRLVSANDVWKNLKVSKMPEVKQVAYESVNRVTNAGKQAWKKDTGLLSIWILGMFTPSPSATIIVPIKPGPESARGVRVTSDYFGQVPPDRLVVKDDVIYFCADGKFRSKIGINPRRTKGVSGSYDADNKVLTIVQYTLHPGVTDYVNSLWKLQDNPYGGDAANCYNDGPPAPGVKPMGPFFELESSSPAAALAPGKSLSHVHRTIHLSGPESALDGVARATLGVSIADIKAGLKNR